MAALPGGVTDVKEHENSLQIDDLARFAVDDHNKKANTLLQFKKVVNAKQQVVSGTIFILTLEVEDSGKKKIYEAKIWEKPWLNFKEVQEFKLIGDALHTIVLK